MPTAALTMDAAAARFELEITIEAAPDAIWTLITERPDEWWVSDLRCVPGPSRMVLDPRAGGTLIEQNDAGGSLLWFTVLAVEPGRSLNCAGHLAPPFGGPCATYLHLLVDGEGDGSVVRLAISMHGHVEEGMLQEMSQGWQLLLESGLKAVAEAGTA